MRKNRSVPADILLPHVVYKNVPEAIAWLTRVFGFREHYRYGEPSGAQMFLGKAYIMVRGSRQGEAKPAQVGAGTVAHHLCRRCGRALSPCEIRGRQNRGGSPRDRIRRKAIRRCGPRRTSLALLETRT